MKLFNKLILAILSLNLASCNYANSKAWPIETATKIEVPPDKISEPVDQEPLVATYDSINKHVFQQSCKDCHNPTGPGKRISLDQKDLLNSPLELIIPGNPDESGLIVALERSDDKRMPPAKEGYPALSDDAKAVIRKWIANGAQD